MQRCRIRNIESNQLFNELAQQVILAVLIVVTPAEVEFSQTHTYMLSQTQRIWALRMLIFAYYELSYLIVRYEFVLKSSRTSLLNSMFMLKYIYYNFIFIPYIT